MRLIVVFVAVVVCPNIGAATRTACPPVDEIRLIAIPQDVSRDEVLRGGETLVTGLHNLTRRRLAECPIDADSTVGDGRIDAVVVFVDAEGKPILPDLETFKLQRGAPVADSDTRVDRAGASALAPGALAFTFNSPSYPWSSEEQANLERELDDFYREARVVYGDPAFSITVNVRKDPTISFAGLYYPSLNEMVIRDASSPEVVCHEMIHAFRDDLLIWLMSYEEGMTRAAEVEVLSRLSPYQSSWDAHHHYGYDVWYEGLNRKAIGARNGGFLNGYVAPLLRYQLSGYAWGKVYIENANFFSDFNTELYALAESDTAVLGNESQLAQFAAGAQPVVEGVSFSSWYSNQFALETQPPVGAFLFQRINQFTVDFFVRDASGYESMQPNAVVHWNTYDYQGSLLAGGSVTTGPLGWAYLSPGIPEGYEGRIQLTVSATFAGRTITDTAFRSWNDESGVFGIVTAFDSGTITITPVGDPGAPTTMSVENGAFSAPSLAGARGEFLAVFNGAHGETVSRFFTKDASDYYLVMGENVDPCVGPDIELARSGEDVTVSWIPHGASAYDVVRGSLLALTSSGGDFTQAIEAINPASDVCLADDTLSLSIHDTRPMPSPGDGEFYLVRATMCGGGGTYDSGAYTQVSSRDGEIAAAAHACP